MSLSQYKTNYKFDVITKLSGELSTSGVISRTLPSTLGFSLQEESSRSSTLGLVSARPLTGDLDFPISDIGECEREGEILLTGKRPSSVSCFTTLDLELS